MTPNLDAAAIKAYETLVKHKVSFAPVDPLPILKQTPGVFVTTFAEMAARTGTERDSFLSSFSYENRDVITTFNANAKRPVYIVTYNQRLPFYMQQRALARELGHIVLGHDGSRPDDVRNAEAITFARHLICPRPLIKALTDEIGPLTMEVVGNLTGCYERCMIGIRNTPGVNVPAELNREVRQQFAEYISNFVNCKDILVQGDVTGVADFGTYMDCYNE